MSVAAQTRYIDRVFTDADKRLLLEADPEHVPTLRAIARMSLCARMVEELDRRALEKIALLERELANLEELQAAAKRWALLAGEWTSLYAHHRARAQRSDADESEAW